jgi:hypothetical protein
MILIIGIVSKNKSSSKIMLKKQNKAKLSQNLLTRLQIQPTNQINLIKKEKIKRV